MALAISGPAFAGDALRSQLGAARDAIAALRADAALQLAQLSPDAAIRIEQRIGQLELLMRDLTNRVEDLAHQQRVLERELRPGQGERAARPVPRPERDEDTEPPRRRGEDFDQPRRRGEDAEPPRRRSEDAEPPRRRGEEDVGRAAAPATAQDYYEQAVVLWRRKDYPAAEAAFVQFLRRFPSDPLAAHAHYWLGETYLAQNRLQDASFQFVDVIRKFPTHARAPDSIIRLAVVYTRQGKGRDACTAYAEYRRKYPNGAYRQHAESEQRRLACS
jgi:tol-pal system protein YbgF